MTAVSVVATKEESTGPTDPPRVKLDVTDTGSPNLFATTVTRLDPDGINRVVRTADGNPLTLSTSGANRVGLLYDYEMPYGAPVTYSTLESPAAVSASVTIDEPRIWLVHPGVPSLSRPIELRAGSLAVEEWPVNQGVLYPMGRKSPVVRTDGQRKSAQSSLTVAVETADDLWAIKAILSDAATLLLNVPASLGLGVETCYIAVGSVRNSRPSDIGSDPHRDVELPYTVVDAPVGGSQAERTLADLMDYASLAAIAANPAYPTLAAVNAGP